MSRIVGSLSLTLADSGPDAESLLLAAVARQQHAGFAEAEVGVHGALVVAIQSAPAGDKAALERCRAVGAGGKLAAYLDGQLFNRQELQAELGFAGRSGAEPAGDAELVLAAYSKWGDGCFERLSGIFAIVVFDGLQRKCLLARDHLGAKSLNYAVVGDRLWFASEFGPLLSARGRTSINPQALLEFTLHGDVLPPRSLFEGVQVLPHGHFLRVDGSAAGPGLHRYYDALDDVSEITHDRLLRDGAGRMLDELDGHFHRSIRDHVAVGGPVAIGLSGGVDSAVLTAIAARYGNVQAIHVSVAQRESLNEQEAAEDVARRLGVPISIVAMDEALYRRELAAATLANEMPLWHVQNLGYYLASRRAGELGARALLCGDTIGSMLSAASMLPWRNMRGPLVLMEHAPPGLRGFFQKVSAALADLPLNSHGFAWSHPLAVQLVDGYARAQLRRNAEDRYRFIPSITRRRILGGRLAEVYHWYNRFYHRGDRLGNAYGVEYRSPFGDVESLRFAMNLPCDYLMPGGVMKWSLKELALRYIPREIAYRKKIAWDMPDDIYLTPFATERFFEDGFCAGVFGLDAATLRSRLPEWLRNRQQFARLVHIEIWGRLFAFGESVDQVSGRIASFEQTRH